MNSLIEMKSDSLAAEILFLDNYIKTLEKIVGNEMGQLWHAKNRQLVKEGTARLKEFNRTWHLVRQSSNSDQLKLLRQKMIRMQQLISQYIMLLEGARTLVKGEIGRINKAKSIRGYRLGNVVRVPGGQLC